MCSNPSTYSGLDVVMLAKVEIGRFNLGQLKFFSIELEWAGGCNNLFLAEKLLAALSGFQPSTNLC